MDGKLKSDFSIDWEEDRYVSRREFFKYMTLASGGLAAGSAALAAWPSLRRGERAGPEPLLIAGAAELAVGGSLPFRFPGPNDLCILLRNEDGYAAFSRRCTHLSCPVQYQREQSRLYCPCHNGAFSIQDGRPLQGPPTAPLRKVELEVREGEVFAVGMVEE